MGSPWLGMGRYFGKTTPRAPGRFLDTSRASGMLYKIRKWPPKFNNTEMQYVTVFFYISPLVSYQIHQPRTGRVFNKGTVFSEKKRPCEEA